MKPIKTKLYWFLIAALSLGLMACGDDDDDDNSSSSTTSTISGTAATGLALASKTVTVVDADGTEVTTITDANGKFTVTVKKSANPFMLKVETSGDPLFSFIDGGGTANITPMTNLALHEANKTGIAYADLDTLFSAFKDDHGKITPTKLDDAKAQIRATVASTLSSNSVDDAFDFFGTAFNADGSGIDGVLDDITITINSGGSINDIFIAINGGAAFNFDFDIDTTGFTGGGSTGGGSGGSLSGTWDLIISGSAGGVNIPNVTINNYPATAVPTSSSAGTAADAFNSSFGAIGTVSNFSYNVTSSSSTQVIATITGTVTMPAQVINGFSIPGIVTNYNLTYTYNKQ